MSESAPTNSATAYRVLARKYRPTRFAELVGQEIMVRTLTNALASGRLAHAFILTGVRGVGKTTTARIIARALNCVGPDGGGGPTAAPCGVCEHCLAIGEDRHVDVLEIDAASHSGVAEVRELTDGVRYAPVSARYKVYVIDEVHMLSTQAFNALLKTLEEPPPHVKFVFATTEIRKIPVTVLSRCQRFDLRRLDTDAMLAFLTDIAAREKVSADRAALLLIARAAEGSARDGLSLLDQAIAHGGEGIDEQTVGDMLGLADRGRVLELLDAVLAGDVADALRRLADMDAAGADPIVIARDLLELTHWLTRLKVAPAAGDDLAVADAERRHGREMADKLSMAALVRAWQILLKGLQEAQTAPMPLAAVEMLVIRLAFVAELPDPAALLRQARGEAEAVPASAAAPSPPRPGARGPALDPAPAPSGRSGQARAAPAPRDEPVARSADREPEARLELPSFEALVDLVGERREATLHAALLGDVHLVHYAQGHVELRLGENAPADLLNRLQAQLDEWTGRRWAVSTSHEEGAPTLNEQRRRRSDALRESVADHPLVAATLASFPDAEIRDVRKIGLGRVDDASAVSAEPGDEDFEPGEGDEE